MIPVKPQIEPADFDEKVRKPGNAWLQAHPDVDPSKYRNFWTACLGEMADLYGHTCAFLAIYFDSVYGADSVDHFIPKSDPTNGKRLAYEWSNYRFCCLGENRKKRIEIPPLDPFDPNMKQDSFFINFVDGSIYPNPAYDDVYKQKCLETIGVLQLNRPQCRSMRCRLFKKYINGKAPLEDLDDLKKDAPFIYQEVVRQGL